MHTPQRAQAQSLQEQKAGARGMEKLVQSAAGEARMAGGGWQVVRVAARGRPIPIPAAARPSRACQRSAKASAACLQG